jgi:hypothetical protein
MAPQRFDWSRFLALATELAQRQDEASLRSAISRAYYYVFHLGLQRAEANHYRRVPGEPSHIQLWKFFANDPESISQTLAQIAIRLKERRERADYRDTYARIADDVPGMLEDAETFTKLLAQLPPRHPSVRSQRQ